MCTSTITQLKNVPLDSQMMGRKETVWDIQPICVMYRWRSENTIKFIAKFQKPTKCRPASVQPAQTHTPAAPVQLLRIQCSGPVCEQPDPDGAAGPPSESWTDCWCPKNRQKGRDVHQYDPKFGFSISLSSASVNWLYQDWACIYTPDSTCSQLLHEKC